MKEVDRRTPEKREGCREERKNGREISRKKDSAEVSGANGSSHLFESREGEVTATETDEYEGSAKLYELLCECGDEGVCEDDGEGGSIFGTISCGVEGKTVEIVRWRKMRRMIKRRGEATYSS